MASPENPVQSDEWSQRLRESLRQKRPRAFWFFLVIGLFLLAGAGLWVWWSYPEPEPPRLVVVALDQISLPDQEVHLQAQFEPHPEETAEVNLAGWEAFFSEKLFPERAGEEVPVVKASAGSHGEISVPWRFPAKAGKADFFVRYLGSKTRPGGHTRGQVFFFPAKTRLLLIEVEETLAKVAAKAWENNETKIPDILAHAKAAQALGKIRGEGFQPVYLALSADHALGYGKVRGWMENRFEDKDPFPKGPVLGRLLYHHQETAADARRELLARLRGLFNDLTAVVGSAESAAIFQKDQVPAYFFGESEPPRGTIGFRNWSEFPDLLPGKAKR